MKAEKLPVITHTWSVYGTIPNPNQAYPHYGQNVSIGVEADSMEGALASAREVYPLIKVMSCHHRGEVHIRRQPQTKDQA